MEDLSGFGILLKEAVSETAMSNIYSGVQVEVDRPVCVKFTREINSPDQLERFRREAQVLMELSHENIAKIFQFGVMDLPFYVMEWLEGETLSQRLERGPLELDEFHAVFDPIFNALEYAHSKGIVHRDIKPSNIFLCRDGDTMKPKIIDFGIAKRIDAEQNAKLTQTGVAIGSPQYMAPEQCSGTEVVVPTDVYSLCVVIYESLTGRPLFAGGSEFELMYKTMNELPDLAGLNKDLTAVLRRGLAKSTAERFQSISELRHALSGKVSPAKKTRSSMIPVAMGIAAVVVLGLSLFLLSSRMPPKIVNNEIKAPKLPLPDADRIMDTSRAFYNANGGEKVRARIRLFEKNHKLTSEAKVSFAHDYVFSVVQDRFDKKPVSSSDLAAVDDYRAYLENNLIPRFSNEFTHKLETLARWYDQNNEPEKAIKFHEKALKEQSKLEYDHAHQDQAAYLEAYADFLQRHDDLRKAEKCLRDAIVHWKTQFKDEYSPSGMNAMMNLAINLLHQKPSRKDEADDLVSKVLTNVQRLTPAGSNHLDKVFCDQSKIDLLRSVEHYYTITDDKKNLARVLGELARHQKQ